MHAVVVKVSIQGEEETSLKYLRENIVPGVSQAPGFVAGYWVRREDQGEGNSVIVFESEEAARGAAGRISEGVEANPGVTLKDVSVGEVVANA